VAIRAVFGSADRRRCARGRLRSVSHSDSGSRNLAPRIEATATMVAAARRLTLMRLDIAMRETGPITGDAPVAVSITTYGDRIKHVHYTIQTIANGSSKPQRIILWIGHADTHLITMQLRDLVRRGLEIRYTTDYGPHKKYYPYCRSAAASPHYELPLVTADDDQLYPPEWLSALIDSAANEPLPVIVAHRAHRIKVANGVVFPYREWSWEGGNESPSYANFATGVSGVLYPLEFIRRVGAIDSAEFTELALLADDPWLHSRSVLFKIPTKQVSRTAAVYAEHHPDAQRRLSDINVAGGNNDTVVAKIYTREVISAIQRDVDRQSP